jgi:ABC-type nitrate/sulfonate/bicarbonate transport system substrate-binding protein
MLKGVDVQNKLTAGAAALLTIAGLALAACGDGGGGTTSGAQAGASGGDCGRATGTTSATVATNPGAQDLVIKTVKAQGLDKKYGLDLNVKSFLNPPATAQAITQHAVDLGFGGLTTMVQARAGGSDVMMIGALSTPGSGVFVPKDSSVQTLGDLKGKRVGSFTQPNGAVSSLLQVYAQKKFGFDLQNQVNGKLHVAPEATLRGLMDKGELDAIYLSVDGTALAQYDGKYREIVNLATAFKEQMGYDPLYLGPVTTERYASKNCPAVRAYVSAIDDAIKYIQTNSSVWQTYAQSLGHPEAASAYQKLYSDSFVTEWTQKQVDDMKKLITDSVPFLGQSFPKSIPDGLFTLNYPVFGA